MPKLIENHDKPKVKYNDVKYGEYFISNGELFQKKYLPQGGAVRQVLNGEPASFLSDSQVTVVEITEIHYKVK